MTIISTKFDLVFDFDIMIADAFEACMANQTCKDEVPDIISIANDMQEDFVDSEGLSRIEVNQK